MGRKAQRRIERLVQIAVLDDPRQRADVGAEGVESQISRLLAVAIDHHRFDRRDARRIERAPHFKSTQ